MDDRDPLFEPIPGANPATPHPVRGAWRGVCNIGGFAVEAFQALLDLVRAPRDDVTAPDASDTPPRHRRRRSEKIAPFPVND
jgi:hypothetical protein